MFSVWFISHVYVTIISFFNQIKQNVKFYMNTLPSYLFIY